MSVSLGCTGYGRRIVLGLGIAAALLAAPASGQEYECFPSCANDGRMIGTSVIGFANFNDFEGTPPATLRVRFQLPSYVPLNTPLEIGLFDPDGRGPVSGKADDPSRPALWDADFPANPGDGATRIPLSYRLCTDPDADFVCDEELFFRAGDAPDIEAADNTWWSFTAPDISAARTADNSFVFLLEISQSTNPEQSWNMLKLRVAKPGRIIIQPNVAFAFGVPITSCTDFAVVYNGQDICGSADPDFSDTTYDGTWSFNVGIERVPGSGPTTPSVTMWDGDFDYGSLPRAFWPDPAAPVVEGTVACFAPGSQEEIDAVPQVDDDDPSTNLNPATGFTEVPPQLASLDANNDGTPGDLADMTIFAVELEGSAFAGSSVEFGNCYELGAPPENWPLDEEFGTAYFLRETLNFGQKIAYRLIEERPSGGDRVFENLNPSGNREWEKFAVDSSSACDPSVADHCVDEPISILEPLQLEIEGMDVLNISHMVFPICVAGPGQSCSTSTECGECSGKVTELTLIYEGAAAAQVRVEQKNGETVFGPKPVAPGEAFSFVGTDKGTLGTEIRLFVDGALDAQLHTSCSQPIGPGTVAGHFLVVGGYSRDGGRLCGQANCAACDGGVTDLTFEYLGGAAHVVIYDSKDPKADKVLFEGDVVNGNLLAISPRPGQDKLASEISIWVDGVLQSKLHTSCSQPIGPGQIVGDFEITEGRSKDGGAMCPLSVCAPLSAGIEFHDREFRWDVTNNGDLDIVISRISISWPAGNGILDEIKREGDTIHKGNFAPGAAVITGGWEGDADKRAIEPGKTDTLKFKFENDAGPGDYEIEIEFASGCVISLSDSTPPGGTFSCDKPIDQLTMVWDGAQPVRIKAWKGSVGSTLLADVDGIQTGGVPGSAAEVSVSGYAGSPNDVVWEVFAAGTSTKLGESEFHLSCSDDDMDGADDCGKRQGNGKGNDASLINDWILEGMVDSAGTLDCTP